MKVTLTQTMLDELAFGEVETFFADHGREPSGTNETPGRRAFCEALLPALSRVGRGTVTVELAGDALAYAANDRYGPFSTRADILRDWAANGEPHWATVARAFEARQRACAEALKETPR